MTNKVKPVKSMDVCTIVSNKKLKGSGLEVGDNVLVTGLKVLPEKHSDPYLQRIYVVAVKFDTDTLLLPGNDNDYEAYLIDPRNLEVVGEDLDKYFRAMLEDQYGNREAPANDTSD